VSQQSRLHEKRRAASSKCTVWRRGHWTGRPFVLGGFFLVAVLGSLCAYALARQSAKLAGKAQLAEPAPNVALPPVHKVTPEEETLSGKTEFGQFPPYSEAERELELMLHGKDEDIDLALANWLIVADIPQFSDITREGYFKQLDALSEQVRQDMVVMQKSGRHRNDPDGPRAHCSDFVDAMHKLGFAYAEKFRQQDLPLALKKEMYTDANNIFLAGLLRTRRGTCVSLPLIYLVIGQRLGLPVHLVTLGQHYFIRWEGPGLRMNIETTIPDAACFTPDDSVYLDTEGMTRDQVTSCQLRNLTSREIVGDLFFTRSGYWGQTGGKCETQCCLDLSRARQLSPEDPAIKSQYQSMFDYYHIKPEYKSIEIRTKPNE
jgi:hypothetical protein